MPIARNTITRAQGLSGLPPATRYHVTGILYYETAANIPAAFNADNPIKVFSIAQAEALGITEADANLGDLWYHIWGYFTMNPDGELWIGIYDDTTVGTYGDIEKMRKDAGEEIRLLGVYEFETVLQDDLTENLSSKVSALQAEADKSISANAPLTIFFAGDISSLTDINTLTDGATETASSVRVLVGEDFSGKGAAAATSFGHSITQLGFELGAWSKIGINEHAGEPAVINFQFGDEFNKIAFANGEELTSAFTDTQLDALTDKTYGFLIRRTTISGAFLNDSRTTVAQTNDYAFVENDRTINEAVRLADAALEPLTYSQMVVNEDGTLSDQERTNISGKISQALDSIAFAFSNPPQIIVNPVLTANNEVEITINLQKTVTNRGFNVTIGLVRALS